MRLLLHGLRLSEDRPVLHRILSKAAPFTHKDVVVVFVTGIGERRGRMVEESIVRRYYGDGTTSAIQLTTSAGLCAMVELFLAGKLPQRGFVSQETARFSDFLATPSGSLFVTNGIDDDLLAWSETHAPAAGPLTA
jgi:saccharopine dehydrogenase-like NADP-dependent oxidoreductase